jgi:hypothetical protein
MRDPKRGHPAQANGQYLTESFLLTLTMSERQQLREAAAVLDKPMTEVVRIALRHYFGESK